MVPENDKDHYEEAAVAVLADIKGDLEQVINKNQDESGSAGSHMEVSDSDNSDEQNSAVMNPLSLKPVFVSKIDREMLDPCLQLQERQ